MSHELLERLGACDEAKVWAEQYNDLQAAWDKCQRGDWMAWVLGRLAGEWGSESHRKLSGVTAQFARLVEAHWTDPASEAAVTLVERYAAGDQAVTQAMLVKAADAARSAVYAAWSAAYAAWSAVYAAWSAADAAWSAADAAWSAADAVWRAADAATLKRCAEIVRAAYPDVPTL